MKNLTAILLALLLVCGTLMGCDKYGPNEETLTIETKNIETKAHETEAFWEFVHKTIDDQLYTYLETNADVPTSIENFREPNAKPEGLIKKVLEKNSDCYLIIYVQSEDDDYFDAVYTFWQQAVPLKGEAIGRSRVDEVHHPTEVNGYEAYWKDTFYIVRGEEPKKEGLALTWHDDQYYYTISCADNAVTPEDLIEIAKSVR